MDSASNQGRCDYTSCWLKTKGKTGIKVARKGRFAVKYTAKINIGTTGQLPVKRFEQR